MDICPVVIDSLQKTKKRKKQQHTPRKCGNRSSSGRFPFQSSKGNIKHILKQMEDGESEGWDFCGSDRSRTIQIGSDFGISCGDGDEKHPMRPMIQVRNRITMGDACALRRIEIAESQQGKNTGPERSLGWLE